MCWGWGVFTPQWPTVSAGTLRGPITQTRTQQFTQFVLQACAVLIMKGCDWLGRSHVTLMGATIRLGYLGRGVASTNPC